MTSFPLNTLTLSLSILLRVAGWLLPTLLLLSKLWLSVITTAVLLLLKGVFCETPLLLLFVVVLFALVALVVVVTDAGRGRLSAVLLRLKNETSVFFGLWGDLGLLLPPLASLGGTYWPRRLCGKIIERNKGYGGQERVWKGTCTHVCFWFRNGQLTWHIKEWTLTTKCNVHVVNDRVLRGSGCLVAVDTRHAQKIRHQFLC